MNHNPVPFLQMFDALRLSDGMVHSLTGAIITEGVIDLEKSYSFLRLKVKKAIPAGDVYSLLESIRKTYGFAGAEIQIENQEETVMPVQKKTVFTLNITSGVIHRAQKVVIYGPEGIGKTTLAAKFPDPLFIDTEAGTQHMDVRRTDAPASWTQLMETVRAVRDTPGVCKTLVLDTIDWAQQLCIRYICNKYQVNSLEDIPYGKGYTYIWDECGNLLNLLSEVVNRGIHVVIVAHATKKPANQPEEFGNYDRYQLKLLDSKQCSSSDKVKEWCDLLLFCNYKTYVVAANKKGTKFKGQGSQRTMYTTRHACWDAKNRVGLPDELPLDYAQLAQYFEADIPANPPANTAPQKTEVSTPQGSGTSAPVPDVADKDMYFYHPESESYWMIQKGEPLHGELDTSAEIGRDMYEWGLRTGKEPGEFLKETDGQMKIAANADVPAGNNASDVEISPPPAQSGTEKPCAADPDVLVTDNGYVYRNGHRLKDALQEFYPLMEAGSITAKEVQSAIAYRGYFPADTPLENLPDDFIRGVLIGAWEQVKNMIADFIRPDEDIPF